MIRSNHGNLHCRFVQALQRVEPDKLAAGVRKREEAFRQRVDGSLRDMDPNVVRITARLHAVLCFAVVKLDLPDAFSAPDGLLRCLEAHRTSKPPLHPFEQLMSFAQRPEVRDLRTQSVPMLSDAELDAAIFLRDVGKRVELCLTEAKLRSLVPHLALFLRDPAVQRAYRPDRDHHTRQVVVRQDHDRDRLYCFEMPWPVV